MFLRYYTYELGIFHANRTTKCLMNQSSILSVMLRLARYMAVHLTVAEEVFGDDKFCIVFFRCFGWDLGSTLVSS